MNHSSTNPAEYIRGRIADMRPELAWQKGRITSLQTWQGRLRARLSDLAGGLPYERGLLNAAVLETKDFGAYTREFVRFESRPGLLAVGYFLQPKECREPAPTVLCLPGH